MFMPCNVSPHASLDFLGLEQQVQASIGANTYVITGAAENKKLQDLLPGIINQVLVLRLCACLCVCLRACEDVRMCVRACMHACVHACV